MPPIRKNKGTAVERVADKFDGFAPLARLLDLDPSAVRHWNDAGKGYIPSRYHRKILDLAKKHRVRLKPGDLVNV